MHFTFGDVLLFIVVIWACALASDLPSLFGNHETGKNANPFRQYNFKRLLKVFIITTGLLVAMAASGIAIEKIAIILAALFVGIGLGLQKIAGNLIAGVILGFERTVKPGDHIAVNNHSGVVKSVGARSCILQAADGTNIIVPNTDMISFPVTNFTAGNAAQRVQLNLPLSIQTKPFYAKKVIEKILKESSLILQQPSPLVLVDHVENVMLNLKCVFWLGEDARPDMVKSAVLESIIEGLTNADIEFITR